MSSRHYVSDRSHEAGREGGRGHRLVPPGSSLSFRRPTASSGGEVSMVELGEDPGGSSDSDCEQGDSEGDHLVPTARRHPSRMTSSYNRWSHVYTGCLSLGVVGLCALFSLRWTVSPPSWGDIQYQPEGPFFHFHSCTPGSSSSSIRDSSGANRADAVHDSGAANVSSPPVTVFWSKPLDGKTFKGGHWFHVQEAIVPNITNKLSPQLKPLPGTVIEDLYLIGHSHAFMTELVPYTRFATTISLMLAAEEAGKALHRVHYLAPANKVEMPSASLALRVTQPWEHLFTVDMVEQRPEDLFVKSAGLPQGVDTDLCAVYGGLVGDYGAFWNTHWYLDREGRADRMRGLASQVCGTFRYDDREGEARRRERRRKVMVYNRDRTRKLINGEEVVGQLQQLLGPEEWEVQMVVHSDKRAICELLPLLAQSDVMITPHGFQSIMLTYLKPGAMLFEVFPHGFNWVGYKALCQGVGVSYVRWESDYVTSLQAVVGRLWESITDDCSHVYLCRWFAKQYSVQMTVEQVRQSAELIRAHFAAH